MFSYFLRKNKHLGWYEKSRSVEIAARYYNSKTKYNQAYRIVIDKRTGKTTSNFHQIRFYTKDEMVALMKKCGLNKYGMRNLPKARVVQSYDEYARSLKFQYKSFDQLLEKRKTTYHVYKEIK